MNIHTARVYIAQARATKHRQWRFILLSWAAKRRLMALGEIRLNQSQRNLF